MENQDEVKLLQKEIDRLTRRNKLLTKRIKKMEEANKNLIEEIEELEAKSEVVNVRVQDTGCPECGSELQEITKPDGSQLYICSNMPQCRYRVSCK